jgi:hypothetical protein
MRDFGWPIMRQLIVGLASALPALGSFTLLKRTRGPKEPTLHSQRLFAIAGAVVLGALAVWLFFALHSWGWSN